MEQFIGKWKLLKNNNFDDFLKYYQYGWIKRKLALTSNIDLTIISTDDPNRITRLIESTFLTAQEDYIFDGEFHITNTNLYKLHKFEDNQILSEVKNDLFHWHEVNIIEGNKLIITRKWNENGIPKVCSQVFIKDI